MAKMTDKELSALLDAEQTAALGYLGGQLSSDREKAMKYYLGEPFGNEVEGRSQVVSSDVADTIEWMLPSLMKMFTAGDDVVSFEPQGKEDEEGAKQATEYNNWIFLRDNDGFRVLYCMFKDALLQRTGVAKVYPEFNESEELDEFVDVPDDVYTVTSFQKQQENEKLRADYAERKWRFSDDKLWYLKEHTETESLGPELSLPVKLHSGVWCRTVKKMKICDEPVPPEEMLISRRSRGDIDEPAYMAHRTQKTASELIELGYDKSKVDNLPSDTPDPHTSMESAARDAGLNEDTLGTDYNTVNRAMRLIWVTEAYIKVDYDGDGIAEMRRVVHAGKGASILENEPWEGPRPFAIISPIIIPHRLIGRSIADQTMEFQLLSSTLWRQTLDNLYLTNNPQKYVDPSAVNIDDLLQPRVGGIIRPPADGQWKDGAITPIVVENFAAASYPMIEMINQMRENRTGVTKYNQGSDADSLNKTARGITQIMTASQQRIELIARVFAEGVKRIFSLQQYYLRRYPDLAKRAIRLRNKQWVEMDPAQWGSEFDLQINVGLGTGNKDQMLGHIASIMAVQEKLVMMQGGPDGPFITPKNIHASATKLVENSGFKNVEEFFADPEPKPGEPQRPQPPPQPTPEQLKLQFEKQKGEQDLAFKQQSNAMELEHMGRKFMMEDGMRKAEAQQKFQANGMMSDQQMQMKREQMQATMMMKMAGKSSKGIDKDADAEEAQILAQGLEKLGASIMELAKQVAVGQQQTIAAITAPKTVQAPSGATYTIETATVN